MSEANPQQEPSMEEILASIRRIISEDDKPEGAAAVARATDDVLELTDIAEEEAAPEPGPAPVAKAPVPETEEEPAVEAEEELSIDDVLDEAASTDDELELRDPAEPAQPAAPPQGPGLLAAQAEAAAGGSLSALVAAVDRAHAASTIGDGARTIEDLVKELMRPMVKQWLDENLPRLTERLVRREIERLARNAEGD
jgi:uncharacterized protein